MNPDIRLAADLGIHAGDVAMNAILNIAEREDNEKIKFMITVIGMSYIVTKLNGLRLYDPKLYDIAQELIGVMDKKSEELFRG